MSIQEIQDKIKSFWEGIGKDTTVALIIILTGVGGYFIGIYSKTTEVGVTPVLIKIEGNIPIQNTPSISSSKNTTSTNPGDSSLLYVASKNGTKYYPVDCGSVSRINEENKVFFESVEKAENAGYTRTTSCK